LMKGKVMDDDMGIGRRVEVVEVVPFQHLFAKLIFSTFVGCTLALLGKDAMADVLLRNGNPLKRYRVQSPVANLDVQPPITKTDD
jgi:hypothetical protein